jgi:hypothetical protein
MEAARGNSPKKSVSTGNHESRRMAGTSFSSDRISGKPHIWRMDLNGDDPKQLTNGDGEHVPDCCIDGKWIVYSSLGGKGTKLWRVDIQGGSPEPIADIISGFPIIFTEFQACSPELL